MRWSRREKEEDRLEYSGGATFWPKKMEKVEPIKIRLDDKSTRNNDKSPR